MQKHWNAIYVGDVSRLSAIWIDTSWTVTNEKGSLNAPIVAPNLITKPLWTTTRQIITLEFHADHFCVWSVNVSCYKLLINNDIKTVVVFLHSMIVIFSKLICVYVVNIFFLTRTSRKLIWCVSQCFGIVC